MTTSPTTVITADTFTEHGHPVWRVTGPLGTVTYRSLGNHLYLEPDGADGESATAITADQVRILAVFETDDKVFDALRAWYARLPELATRAEPDPFDPAAAPPPPPATEVPADVRTESDRETELCDGTKYMEVDMVLHFLSEQREAARTDQE